MANLPFKRPVVQLDARLTTATIKKYHSTLARRRAAGEQANSSDLQGPVYRPKKETNNDGSNYDRKSNDKDYKNHTRKASGVYLFNETNKSDATAINPMRLGSRILRNASTRSRDSAMAKIHSGSAPYIFNADDKHIIDRALISLTKSGFDLKRLAEAVVAWIKAHPWEPAAIVVPLIMLPCTTLILDAVGFKAGGIAAGKWTCFPPWQKYEC